MLLRYIIATIGVVLLFLVPQVMLGQTGLVPCDEGCTLCDGFILLKNIYTFLLGLLASVGVFAFVAGGLLILTARANTQQVQRGKEVITNAIIGIVLVAGSFLILNAIVFIFLGQNDRDARGGLRVSFIDAGSAFEIISGQGLVVNNCDTANRFQPRGDDPVSGGPPSSGSGGGPVGDLPEGTNNIACLANDSISDELSAVMRAISYYEGTESSEDYFTAVGGEMFTGGRAFPSKDKAVHPGIITCCNSTAFGRFQFIDTTWDSWAQQAGINETGVRLNTGETRLANPPNWLMTPANQDLAVKNKLLNKGITDGESFINSPFRCKWTSISGCPQENDRTRNTPFIELYNKLLEEEQDGVCS